MQFTDLPISSHPRVALRPLTSEDLPAWYAYLSQPLVYEHTSWNVQSADDLQSYVGIDPAATAPLRLAIAPRSSDQLIGTAGFHTVSPLNRSAEIAYDLAPGHWGQGIATTVCHTLVDWAFGHLGLLRVQATCLESNERSSRVLETCGFQREGMLRSYRMVRGTPGNFWMFSRITAP
nr:GNAT family protein [uncultured Roseateles sp.]